MKETVNGLLNLQVIHQIISTKIKSYKKATKKMKKNIFFMNIEFRTKIFFDQCNICSGETQFICNKFKQFVNHYIRWLNDPTQVIIDKSNLNNYFNIVLEKDKNYLLITKTAQKEFLFNQSLDSKEFDYYNKTENLLFISHQCNSKNKLVFRK